jgi:hypothetical protein
MADFLEEKKREFKARLNELRPLVEEYHALESAVAALEGLPPGGATATRGTRARSATKTAAKGTGRRGRPRGSGTRSKQALEVIRARPGITISELAQTMGIQQNYLYRVLPGLEKERQVRKQGKGWHPRAGS